MKIGIILPIYKNERSSDEDISYTYLQSNLNCFDIIIIKPDDLKLSCNKYQMIDFPASFFKSIPAYSKLLLQRQFYEKFLQFDYILIYQLDALVFSSDLAAFCHLGYDYIGAPIFKRYSHKPVVSRVGNGGLSLRRVSAFLDVLNSSRYIHRPVPFMKQFFTTSISDLGEWPVLYRWRKKFHTLRAVRVGVEAYTQSYTMNEDLFWSDRARLFNPDFNIAPINVALKFAFDRHPRACFERNDFKLPFGAHAWARWDREFWEPFIRD